VSYLMCILSFEHSEEAKSDSSLCSNDKSSFFRL